jgi:acetone carboxylase alpha subunit
VADDVNQGHLLPHYAPRIYGVKLAKQSNGAYVADPEGTEALREGIRGRRAVESVPTRTYLKTERERVLEGRFIRPIRECYNACMALAPGWAEHYRRFWDLPQDFTFSLEETT